MKFEKVKARWRDAVLIPVVAAFLFSGSACSDVSLKLGLSDKEKREIVDLPTVSEPAPQSENHIGYYENFVTLDESTLVLTLGPEDELYRERYWGEDCVEPGIRCKHRRSVDRIDADGLPELLRSFFAEKRPWDHIVYLKADRAAGYEKVLKFIDIVRKAEIDRLGLLAVPNIEGVDNDGTNSFVIVVWLPTDAEFMRRLKLDPLTLVVTLHADRRLYLNKSEMGTLSEPERLSDRLKEIFATREKEGVLRENTGEVEKTVLLRAAGSVSYGDLARLAEIVNAAGARPIGLELDELELIDKPLSPR